MGRLTIRVAGIAAVLLASVTVASSEGSSPNACAGSCRDAHNKCRIVTKGNSSRCDAQLQACLQGCMKR